MKPLIICIIGRSGSGKTTMAEYVENEFGIDMIQSYTDRKPRYEGENGHMFLTKDEFSKLSKNDMIAYTEFGDNRYCCLKKDVKNINTYVIDEKGIEYLKNKYSRDYTIVSIKIKREEIDNIDENRKKRDKNMFYLPDEYFDYLLDNDKDIESFYNNIKDVIDRIIVKYYSSIYTKR